MATGLVIWTISDEAGIRPPPGDPPGWIRSNAPGYATFSDGGGTWVLDTNAGELLTRTPALERLLGAPVRSSCEEHAGYDRAGPCYVQYDGRVVWEGALAWTHYLGLIEVPGDLALEGAAPVAAVRVRTPPGLSSRSPVAGPLLVYEVRGYDEYVAGGSEDAAPSPTTRLIAYDAGTRRAWTLFEGARARATRARRRGPERRLPPLAAPAGAAAGALRRHQREQFAELRPHRDRGDHLLGRHLVRTDVPRSLTSRERRRPRARRSSLRSVRDNVRTPLNLARRLGTRS